MSAELEFPTPLVGLRIADNRFSLGVWLFAQIRADISRDNLLLVLSKQRPDLPSVVCRAVIKALKSKEPRGRHAIVFGTGFASRILRELGWLAEAKVVILGA
jgi:hypothetical protein